MGCHCTKESEDLDIQIDKEGDNNQHDSAKNKYLTFLGDYRIEGTPKESSKVAYGCSSTDEFDTTFNEAKMIDEGAYSETPNSIHQQLKYQTNISNKPNFMRSNTHKNNSSRGKVILREGKLIFRM